MEEPQKPLPSLPQSPAAPQPSPTAAQRQKSHDQRVHDSLSSLSADELKRAMNAGRAMAAVSLAVQARAKGRSQNSYMIDPPTPFAPEAEMTAFIEMCESDPDMMLDDAVCDAVSKVKGYLIELLLRNWKCD